MTIQQFADQNSTGEDQQTKPVHLYRGAPIVRRWSKYKEIVPTWTLCGARLQITPRGGKREQEATADETKVTCYHCRDLAGLSLPETKSRPARQNQILATVRGNSAIAGLVAMPEGQAGAEV